MKDPFLQTCPGCILLERLSHPVEYVRLHLEPWDPQDLGKLRVQQPFRVPEEIDITKVELLPFLLQKGLLLVDRVDHLQ